MSRINVVVASESEEVDLLVPGIAERVAARSDMRLVSATKTVASDRVQRAVEIAELLKSIPTSTGCALVLVCESSQPVDLARRFLTLRSDLVVVEVTIGRRDVRIGFLDPRLDNLLSAVHDLVNRIGTPTETRISQVRLDAGEEPKAGHEVVKAPAKEPSRSSFFSRLFGRSGDEATRPIIATGPVLEPEPREERQEPASDNADTEQGRAPTLPVLVRASELPSVPLPPLFQAAVDWLHASLRKAIDDVSEDHEDAHGVSLTRATLLELLTKPRKPNAEDVDEALDKALSTTDPASEPLARAASVFELNPLEFKLFILALAPELDVLYQRCIGFLSDDMSRRTGTLALYCSLLGSPPNVRRSLASSDSLSRWLVFETAATAGDEPLRVDPFVVKWLLGEHAALAMDARVRRVMRHKPWLGAKLLLRREERDAADRIMHWLIRPGEPRWLVLGGEDSAGWRALVELGGESRKRPLMRIDAATWSGIDLIDLEEMATRIGRSERLTRDVLIVDVTNAPEGDIDRLERFLSSLDRTQCRGAIICDDAADVARHLGASGFSVSNSPPISRATRVAAFRAAARGAGADLSEEDASSLADRYPLRLNDLEAAMHLAAGQAAEGRDVQGACSRFEAACRLLAAEGLSQFAEHIEPAFRLEDVVLPPDRTRQLKQIVEHVRLAPKVFEGWKFGEQLPYGRGVAALFFGPSGTGKTMAAMGVARELRVPLLRFDLSRVVSKYIGDTEKNIDRIFDDAQRSGAAILIDEADALLGKRSEVKDAHDRYANIEVAYLLQRMEAYQGLAILTTNMRQNLDPAFLRRLRFSIEFPRPDVAARERIWRFCLPDSSHDLDDAAFRLLARRIDLTGGHIRQITLHAAFSAAAANRRIKLTDIEDAARAEFAKLGMAPVELVVNANRSAA